MEEQEPPPPLSSNNSNSIPYIFTGSITSNTSILLQPSSLLLNQQQQLPTQDSHQNIVSSDNIDWMGLLSGGGCSSSSSSPIPNGYNQKPQSPTASLQGSYRNNNISEVRDHQYGGISTSGNKGKGGRSRKSVPPRIAFHTRSSEDILDDGYKWRKYGQKAVKNSKHPRSYYRCTHHTCNVKKQIQRLSRDTGIVVTTYEGIHNHPCEKLMETLSPLLRQLQFLSRF